MPAHRWDGSGWVETTAFVRQASSWTDDDDNLFAWDGADWVLIQPLSGSGDVDLLPVENLHTTFVDDHTVLAAWDLPTQPFDDPTEVWVRIPERSDTWLIYDYPQTTFSHVALDPDTPYQLQVLLAIRTAGIVTAMSAVRSIFFTTDPAVVGAPAPDPGGTGGDSIVPITPLPGGGPVGGPGCWWEWELFILDQTTLAYVTTGITGTFAGTETDFHYDLATLDTTRVYKFRFCENCDGVDGDCHDGPPFNGIDDWDADCGGIAASSSAAFAVTQDAVWAMPEICTADGAQGLFDRISHTALVKGPAFANPFVDFNGEQGVIADASGGIVWTAGLAAVPTTIQAGQDFTVFYSVGTPDLTPAPGLFAQIAMGVAHVIQQRVTATGWSVAISFYTDAGNFTLESPEFPFDQDYHQILVSWDDDGMKELYVDDSTTPADSGGNGISIDDSYMIADSYVAGIGAGAFTRMHYGWDRLLSSIERAEIMMDTPTGGTAEVVGPYRYHIFTTDDTFHPNGTRNIDYWVLAAGGASGGGRAFINGEAGGGSGELVTGSMTVSTSQAITIGVGGTFANGANNGTPGNPGANTTFGAITALGGEGGGTDGAVQGGDTGNNQHLGSAGSGGSFTAGGGGGTGADANGHSGGIGTQIPATGTVPSGLPNAGKVGGGGRGTASNATVTTDGRPWGGGDGTDHNGIANCGAGGCAGGNGSTGLVVVRYLI